jgi:hypothetical protein
VTQKKKGHEDNTVDNEGEEDPVSPEVCNIAKKLVFIDNYNEVNCMFCGGKVIKFKSLVPCDI